MFCTFAASKAGFKISGVMISLTSDVTIAPKAVAMITPTARSTTLPRSKNALRSFNIFIISFQKIFTLNYILIKKFLQAICLKFFLFFKNKYLTKNVIEDNY